MQRIGERLRRFVTDAGWAQHERLITQALAEHRPVFLTIRSSAAELYALPWELLTLKSGQPIGELDGLLIRFEWPESPSAEEQPAPRPEGGRILLAWSAAAGAVPAAEHIAAIAAAAAAGFHTFSSRTEALRLAASAPVAKTASDVIANASLERIVRALEEAKRSGQPVAILHLLCHGAAVGSTFGLALDGEDGPVVVDAGQLRQQLAPFASMVRLVFLSACDSGNLGALGNQLGSVAQALHRCGFQSVIASRFPLSVAGSTLLTERFYGELLAGLASVETAFLAARRALARSEISVSQERRSLDWASMQLYARHEDGDDTRPVIFRPYRGLLAFQPEHRRFFFGRNKEVREILSDLQALIDRQAERFLVVAGASGTGKSSVVFAGAVPQLLESSPQLGFLRMRPGSDPERALNEALAGYPAGAKALLVVDQFEEVFTQTEVPAAREAFIRRLWSLASAPEPGLRILITLRVDFIGRCGELVVNAAGLRLDRIAYDESHRVFIAQLEPEQLRAAIVEPARKVGLELQAGLADRMLQEVGNEPGALPLLEDALDVLWQRRAKRLLTQATYDKLGGVIGALQRRADAIVSRLAKEDLLIAQRLLLNLVAVADDTTLDTRLRVALADLQHAFSASPAAGFERVLKEMVSARLLVQDGNEQMAQVEVAHEALIRRWPMLRAWLDEDRAGLLMQRRVKQAAQQWASQARDESLLYRGSQLAHATEWRKTWASRLGDLEQQFLDASDALRVRQEAEQAERQRRAREAEERLAEEKRQKEQQKLEAAQVLARRTRLAAVVLGGAFVIAAGAGVQAYLKWQLANQKTVEAQQLTREAQQKTLEVQQKSAEVHDGLLVAVAQTFTGDPTMAATILREAGHRDTTLWLQAASEALQIGISAAVLRGHPSPLTAVAFSPDGTKVVTGHKDKTACIWSADGSAAPVVLTGHEDAVTAVAFRADGKQLVTGSADKTARVWNADGTSAPIVLKGHEAAVTAVAYSPDGSMIVTATGAESAIARVWNAAGCGAPIVFLRIASPITSVAYSPDGKKIAAGLVNRTACIWNADGTAAPVVLKGHTAVVTAVAYSPDGTKLATASADKTGRIWNADGSGAPIILQGHKSAVTAVAYGPDGGMLVTGSEDRTARLWHADGTSAEVLKGHLADVTAVAFSFDGKKIATGSVDETARIWNATESSASVVRKEHHAVVAAAAYSPNGELIATGTGFGDNAAHIWNADGSGTPVVLKGHASQVAAVAFSPDGRLVATGSWDHTARLWKPDGSGTPIVLAGHTAEVSSVAFSPDGQLVATGSWDHTARLWKPDGSGTPIVLAGHADAVSSVAFSPDGRLVATGSWDRTVRLWKPDGSGTPIVLAGHADAVSSVAFSPDGKLIVTGSKDKTARSWNAADASPRLVLRHLSAVSAVACSPDGKKLVTAATDGTARVWNADGSSAQLLQGHRSELTAVAFSPSGKRLVSGSQDKTARIWIVESDALLEALWSATSDCLPVDRRHDLLLESLTDAQQGHERCQKEVARRRGWPALAAP